MPRKRDPQAGKLLEDVVADLRDHDWLLELLDLSDLEGVDGPDTTTQQIYSAQTLQDTDFPVGVSIGLVPAAGGHRGSSTSTAYIVQATVTVRLAWRQAIDSQVAGELSEARMYRIQSAVGDRAALAFGVDYLSPQGFAGGADILEVEDGAQWSLPGRWRVERSIVGQDGPRA
ncbi:hypothetical protein EL22_17000 [Halostagnicola sp. A56]|uniref:hypothetical protein n=1 Tax=Halostagnicola sp. A56 TaxID=1495067 RepID=UPI00049F26AB|nr:hypothetical protein [Halostagnicola sp. A56]KDE59824.1 hypothetical protein EL22_17000 [Halostagnicola sp. A56]